MFVITHNNVNYDSGGEYPIGFKNTKEEAESFCELSRIKLREYQKTIGILVTISFLKDFEENNKYKELMDFFKDASFISDDFSERGHTFRFFIQGGSIKIIENYLRSFKIRGESPYTSCSVYPGTLANFYGFDDYSDFYFYDIKELGESI